MKIETVCFDTSILIWGIKGESSHGQDHMVEKARALIKDLEEKKINIAIPAPVVAELTINCSKDEREKYFNDVSRKFKILPFDLKAAKICSEKYNERLNERNGQNTEDDPVKMIKAKMKYDILILSIAVSNGIKVIYSHDNDIKKLGNGLIDVRDVPDIPIQTELF